MDGLVMRRAVPGDAEKVSALIRDAMESYRRDSGISRDVLESLSESVESVAHRIRRHRCLCLFDGEKIVGTITLSVCHNPMKYNFSRKTEYLLSTHNKCGYISRFAVSDELRQTGLGARLMNEALSTFNAERIELVLLHTAVANRKMREFYLASGFELIDSENSRGYERGLFAYSGTPVSGMAETA